MKLISSFSNANSHKVFEIGYGLGFALFDSFYLNHLTSGFFTILHGEKSQKLKKNFFLILKISGCCTVSDCVGSGFFSVSMTLK